MAQNLAAWLDSKGAPLRVGDAPMPTPGPADIVIKNPAVAINPLDWHMQDAGIFVKQWPAILGCDVAGEAYEVGRDVARFKKGDRAIGHTINLATGEPHDAAFALYSTGSPSSRARNSGSRTVIRKVRRYNAKYYPWPPKSLGKSIVIYGGSSSVGVTATQIAIATGLRAIVITSKRNEKLAAECGAVEIFDYKDPNVVHNVVAAVRKQDVFVGIFDAISIPDTYAHDLEILSRLGGGHLICTHPPPSGIPHNVKAGMVFGVHDVAGSTWENFVTPALESGQLKCLPKPSVVGKGLHYIQKALEFSRSGVSGQKLVVDLS